MKRDFSETIFTSTVLLGATFLLGACACKPCVNEPKEVATGASDEVKVAVTFDADGCPQSVDPANFYVENTKFIFWQSVDGAGNKTDQGYRIYFDPFSGQPLKSDSHGQIKSNRFDPHAPTLPDSGVGYKYSIVGDNCPGLPLDPRFRLR